VYAVNTASVSMRDSLVMDNRAVLYGAGIMLYEAASATLTSVNCSGNIAEKYGGEQLAVADQREGRGAMSWKRWSSQAPSCRHVKTR